MKVQQPEFRSPVVVESGKNPQKTKSVGKYIFIYIVLVRIDNTVQCVLIVRIDSTIRFRRISVFSVNSEMFGFKIAALSK